MEGLHLHVVLLCKYCKLAIKYCYIAAGEKKIFKHLKQNCSRQHAKFFIYYSSEKLSFHVKLSA